MNAMNIVNVQLKRVGKEALMLTAIVFFGVLLVHKHYFKDRYQKKKYVLAIEKRRLNLAKELTVLQTRIPKLKKMMFKTGDVGYFIGLFNELMFTHQMKVGNIVPGKILSLKSSKRQVFTLTAQGTLNSIQQLLAELQNHEPMLFVARLDISHDKDRKVTSQEMVDDPLLNVKMNMYVFSQKGT